MSFSFTVSMDTDHGTVTRWFTSTTLQDAQQQVREWVGQESEIRTPTEIHVTFDIYNFSAMAANDRR